MRRYSTVGDYTNGYTCTVTDGKNASTAWGKKPEEAKKNAIRAWDKGSKSPLTDKARVQKYLILKTCPDCGDESLVQIDDAEWCPSCGGWSSPEKRVRGKIVCV